MMLLVNDDVTGAFLLNKADFLPFFEPIFNSVYQCLTDTNIPRFLSMVSGILTQKIKRLSVV
jgi:hypothetical protein